MSSTIALEKEAPLGFLYNNAVAAALSDTYTSFSERRAALGLSNPGSVDKIAKEVQRDVFLTNSMFSGLRADLTKAFSVNPYFNVSHAFASGSQALAPYTFAALYGTSKVFMQGTVDNDSQVTAQLNYRWAPALVSKVQMQLQGAQAMAQFDNEYTGNDFTASIKAINPSAIDGGLTGIFIGSYLQSVTPSLALGLEAIWQRAALNQGPETAMSYCAKYKGSDWIATAQLQAQGAISTSYWRKLTDKVEVGVDCNLQFAGLSGAGMMGGPVRKEGVTTLGAKYDFRMSTFRAQVDSTGKLSCLLEKVVAPVVRMTFASEMDHVKQSAKIGLAVSIESAGEELQEQATAPPSFPV
ncbi:Mitochondrial import receptor subunit [Lachnellula hyalina]|uniref:Translocase of outer membrane 40 kDa subunit n=1 Tax=Lachnellula hyalina TaxID=1316788 RepID=A0A8H8R093_9HELO|nr:Mitochondrial import receptor subunit [Lachnellula hyalina]TVY26128.1 Mitochondrial import receptor subunit [Lachnellula hyalina]